MATGIQNYPRIVPPGGAYPFGNIKDNATGDPGTPVNQETYSDMHQFLAKLLDEANVTANVLPDNLTNGYQYLEALVRGFNYNLAEIFKLYIGSTYSTVTAYRISGLATRSNDGLIFFDGNLYFVTGNAGGACGGGLVDVINFTNPMEYDNMVLAAFVTCAAAGTGDICDYSALEDIDPVAGAPVTWITGVTDAILVSFANNRPIVLNYTTSGIGDAYIDLTASGAVQGSKVTLMVDAAGATGIIITLPGSSRIVERYGSATISGGYIVVYLEYVGYDGSSNIFAVGYGN